MYEWDAYLTMKSRIVHVPQWVNKADGNGYSIVSKEGADFTIEELIGEHERSMP